VMGEEKGYIKFCCFTCKWDRHAKSVHSTKINWPLHKLRTLATKSIAHQPLVDMCEVSLPPLHIKLCLMKNFVKALDRNGLAFSVLGEKFPRLNTEKIRLAVFTDPNQYVSCSENLVCSQ